MDDTIKTPCVGVCALDAASGLCFGCARSGEEIAQWRFLTPQEREDVMRTLPQRLSRLHAGLRSAANDQANG